MNWIIFVFRLDTRIIQVHSELVTCVAFLASGELISSSQDSTIRVWNPQRGELIQTLIGHTDNVNSLYVLPNGQLASGPDDTFVKIWNPLNGELVRTLGGHQGASHLDPDLACDNSGRLASARPSMAVTKHWHRPAGARKTPPAFPCLPLPCHAI